MKSQRQIETSALPLKVRNGRVFGLYLRVWIHWPIGNTLSLRILFYELSFDQLLSGERVPEIKLGVVKSETILSTKIP